MRVRVHGPPSCVQVSSNKTSTSDCPLVSSKSLLIATCPTPSPPQQFHFCSINLWCELTLGYLARLICTQRRSFGTGTGSGRRHAPFFCILFVVFVQPAAGAPSPVSASLTALYDDGAPSAMAYAQSARGRKLNSPGCSVGLDVMFLIDRYVQHVWP